MPFSSSAAWTTTIACVLVVLRGCLGAPAMAATLLVGAGMPYTVPSAAARAAHDGDRIDIAAGSYSDCAVWTASNLTIEGAGPDATVISGRPCMGKALFVMQGHTITVRGLTLTGAHVADFNGAGIRAEGGELTVEHVRFSDDEDGIMSGALPGVKIIVRDSEFIGDGTCEGGGGCAHGIYAGHIGLLRVEHSRFLRTRAGHHIKSRALRTEVIGCDMEDGTDGTSSFAVDVPDGGTLVLRDNHIEKGPRSGNHVAAVMIGEEGASQATPEIIVAHNTLRVDGGYESHLLGNRTSTAAELTGNTLQGNARALLGPGRVR